jgi:hypothetical protein
MTAQQRCSFIFSGEAVPKTTRTNVMMSTENLTCDFCTPNITYDSCDPEFPSLAMGVYNGFNLLSLPIGCCHDDRRHARYGWRTTRYCTHGTYRAKVPILWPTVLSIVCSFRGQGERKFLFHMSILRHEHSQCPVAMTSYNQFHKRCHAFDIRFGESFERDSFSFLKDDELRAMGFEPCQGQSD